MDSYSINSGATVPEHHNCHRFALGAPQHSHSRQPNAFYLTKFRHQRSYHNATAMRLERLTAPFYDHP